MKKFLLFLILFLIIPSVHAKTLGELKKELENFEMEQKEAEYNREKTQAQLNQNYANLKEANTKISEITKERKQLTEDIENLNNEIEKRDKEMKDIISFLQIANGESAYLEYAFGAQDFTDFIYRVAVSEQLTSYNYNLIKEYNELIEENNKKKDELNIKEQELEKAQKEYAKEIEKLGSKLDELGDLKLSLSDQIKAQKEAIDMYEKLGCKDNEDIETCGRNYLPPGTSFYRPTQSGYITSEWGHRCFVLNGSWYCDFHYGNDVSDSNYTPPVYASANGVVSLILYQTSCGGNQVYIQHNINGVTYTTQYAHLLSVNVKKGEVVNTNTIIGYMGGIPSLTTWDTCSTGQHLHFALAKGLHPDGTDNWWSHFIASQLNPRDYVNFPSGLYNRFTDRITKYN